MTEKTVRLSVVSSRLAPGDLVDGYVEVPGDARLRRLDVRLERIEFATPFSPWRHLLATVRLQRDAGNEGRYAFALRIPDDAVASFVAPHGSVHWVLVARARFGIRHRLEDAGRVSVSPHRDRDDPGPPRSEQRPPEAAVSPSATSAPPVPMSRRWRLAFLIGGVLLLAAAVLGQRYVTGGRAPGPIIGSSVLGSVLLLGGLMELWHASRLLAPLRRLPPWSVRMLLVGIGVALVVTAFEVGSAGVGTFACLLLLGAFLPSETGSRARRRESGRSSDAR